MAGGGNVDEMGPPSPIALAEEGTTYLIQVERVSNFPGAKKLQVLKARVLSICEPASDGHALVEVILPGTKQWVELAEPVYTGMLAHADHHELAVKKRKKWTPIYGEVLLVGAAVEPSSNKSRSGSQADGADSQGSKRASISARPLDDSLAGDVFDGVSRPSAPAFFRVASKG